MAFTSLEFVFLFYPFVLCIYHLLNKKHPTKTLIFLLFCSFFFVYKANFTSVIVLAISVIMNYVIAYYIQNCKQKALIKTLVFSGVILNIALLLSFKFIGLPSYENLSNYIEQDVNEKLTTGIPLGLSFYTLYQISYLIDVYKKKAKSISFMKYLLSVTLFAQLPSGPIFSYKKIASQFKLLGKLDIDRTMVYSGISLFSFGLFKKIIFADPLSKTIDLLYFNLNQGGTFTLEESIFATWGFLLQLYFDFSAYSDMAIGIGLSLGLKFPINFNSPLKATNFGDYILNWHISLISFTRDYVFLNVSKGIRKIMPGSAVRKQLLGWVSGIFVAYIVIAAWHSPTLNSLISGVYIGVIIIFLQVASQFLILKKKKKEKKSLLVVQKNFKRILIISVASLVSAALRVDDNRKLGEILEGFGNLSLEKSLVINNIVFFGFKSLSFSFLNFIIFTSIIVFYLPNTMELFGLVDVKKDKWYHKLLWKPNLFWGVLLGLFLAFYLIIGHNNTQDFLYERF